MNKAKCKKCGDIIQSKHRHDFVECKCGEIFVDGGEDYYRRGANDTDNFIDLSNDNQIYNKIDKVSKNTSSGSKVVDELEAMIEKLPHHEMAPEMPIPEERSKP